MRPLTILRRRSRCSWVPVVVPGLWIVFSSSTPARLATDWAIRLCELSALGSTSHSSASRVPSGSRYVARIVQIVGLMGKVWSANVILLLVFPGSANTPVYCNVFIRASLLYALSLSPFPNSEAPRWNSLSLFSRPSRGSLSPKSARSRARCSPRHILISVHGSADSTMPNPRVHTSLTDWIGLPDPDSSGCSAALKEVFSSKITCEGCDV